MLILVNSSNISEVILIYCDCFQLIISEKPLIHELECKLHYKSLRVAQAWRERSSISIA